MNVLDFYTFGVHHNLEEMNNTALEMIWIYSLYRKKYFITINIDLIDCLFNLIESDFAFWQKRSRSLGISHILLPVIREIKKKKIFLSLASIYNKLLQFQHFKKLCEIRTFFQNDVRIVVFIKTYLCLLNINITEFKFFVGFQLL